MKPTIAACLLILLTSGEARAQSTQLSADESKSLNLAAYGELLRADVRAARVSIITEVMGFTEAEDKAFWPIYREYEAEMTKLGDARVAMIEEYIRGYSKMDDALADKLASRALQLEAERHAAKAKCHERVKKALSPRTALRFLHVEQQLQLLMDLQIAASLPVAQ